MIIQSEKSEAHRGIKKNQHISMVINKFMNAWLIFVSAFNTASFTVSRNLPHLNLPGIIYIIHKCSYLIIQSEKVEHAEEKEKTVN